MKSQTKFSENLRKLIKNNGLKQKKFSKQLDIAETTLSRYLSGDREPNLRNLVKISQKLNISIDELVL